MPRANELTKPVQIAQTVPPLRSVQSVIDEHKSEGSFHVREPANGDIAWSDPARMPVNALASERSDEWIESLS